MASKFEGKDSDEEQYFEWYCEDLKQAGILNNYYYKAEKFPMISGFKFRTFENKPRSVKVYNYTLSQPKTYTPDWLMIWNINSPYLNIFTKRLTDDVGNNFLADHDYIDNYFYCQNRPITLSTHIDIKPKFTQRDSDAAVFSWKRSLLLEKHRINVQAVIIQDLFSKTFTPQRYLRCDITSKARKISDWEPITLNQFINK